MPRAQEELTLKSTPTRHTREVLEPPGCPPTPPHNNCWWVRILFSFLKHSVYFRRSKTHTCKETESPCYLQTTHRTQAGKLQGP